MTEALRLFHVDADDDVALLMRKCLERTGYQVTQCRSAADAQIVIGHTPFDLVLTEQRLPDMSGLDLLAALNRDGIWAPVLMVTAHGDEHLASRALRAGALDYLVKDPALTFLADLPKRVSDAVARHRLEEKNRLLVQALDSAHDGIMITNLDGTILKANPALEALTGYGKTELVGRSPRLFKSGIHAQDFYASMWRTIRAGKSWQGDITNRRKDGSYFQAHLTISPIRDHQGRLAHFVAIQRDVTAHKHLERQLLQAQKMQSVGTLAGGVAHEFNNLLTGINGYAALGRRQPDVSPAITEFLRHIVNLSERAAVLTRQLLVFARKPSLVRKPTDVRDLIRETAELVSRTLHIEVAIDLDGNDVAGPCLVDADGNQLQQVLINLALNARDAVAERAAFQGETPTSSEGPSIVFRSRHTALPVERAGYPQHVPAGDYVLIQVADRGTGMMPEILNRALDPFFTTKEVGYGTGLGLSTVYGIVQGHHGFLTIESTPGEGTCVSIYLPRLMEPRGEPSNINNSDRAEVNRTEGTASLSILVIDDELSVLDVMRRFLEIAGHRVTCAASSQEAFDLRNDRGAVELVILDLMMPREDAADNVQRLRQHFPGAPILLCTGLPPSAAASLLAQPAVSLIRKPFNMNELSDAVQKALGAKKTCPQL